MKSCLVCMEENDKLITCKTCDFIICNSCFTDQINLSYKEIKNVNCANCKSSIFHSDIKNKVIKDLYNKTLQRYLYKKFDNEFTNINNKKKLIEELHNKRDIALSHMPLNIQSIIKIAYIKNLKKISLNHKKSINEVVMDAIKPCLNSVCIGKLKDNKCILCDSIFCLYCDKKLNDKIHICKEEDLETIKFIKETSVKCPECSVNIHRSSGCAEMRCTFCGTNFYYNDTSQKSYGNNHNDHINYSGIRTIADILNKDDITDDIKNELNHYINSNINYNLFDSINKKKISPLQIAKHYKIYKKTREYFKLYNKVGLEIYEKYYNDNITIDIIKSINNKLNDLKITNNL